MKSTKCTMALGMVMGFITSIIVVAFCSFMVPDDAPVKTFANSMMVALFLGGVCFFGWQAWLYWGEDDG